MAHVNYAVGSVVLGSLIVGVAVLVSRLRGWRSYSPQAFTEHVRSETALSRPRSGVTTWVWTWLSVAYFGLVFGVFAGTLGAVTGRIDARPVLYGLGGLLALFAVVGIYLVPGFRRAGMRAGYRLKRTVLFRRRPLWSLVVGWATFGAVLLMVGGLAVALWTLARGPISFLGVFAVVAVLVALYVATSVGGSQFRIRRLFAAPVEVLDGAATARHGGSRGSVRLVPRRPKLDGRVLPVIRGWIGTSLLLLVGAVGAGTLWHMTGGGTGFLVGLLAAALLVAAYAVSTTW